MNLTVVGSIVKVNSEPTFRLTTGQSSGLLTHTRDNGFMITDGIFVQVNVTPYMEKLTYKGRQLKKSNLVTKCYIAGCEVYCILPGRNPSETEHKVHIKDMNIIQSIANGSIWATIDSMSAMA